MRVAVTGGSGFVGGHLVERLRARGDQVLALARSPAAERALRAPNVEIVPGDLGDTAALARLVAGADVVFHLAGLVAARDEAEFHRVNRDGTARVAAAVREAGVGRLVLVSSLAAAGPTVPGRPLDETAPPQPVTPYGRSKLSGEEAVRESGVGYVIVRPPTVYGPNDRELLRVFRWCRRGFAPLLGDGRQELSLIHVDDLARALLAVAEGPSAEGRVYHAAHPEPLTQRVLIAAIGRAVGRQVRIIRIPAPLVRAVLQLTGAIARLRGRATLLSPHKAAELLAPAWTCLSQALARDTGWRAEIDLDAGLAETARWYREHGWL